MDSVKERIEELLLTCVSDSYDLEAGSRERSTEVENVVQLTELRIKLENDSRKLDIEEQKLSIEQDRNDIDSERNRDDVRVKIEELEANCRDSRRRFIGDLAKTILVGVAIPVLMVIDEHGGELLGNRVFKFWSKPKV